MGTKWDIPTLEKYRHQMDAEADAAIAFIYSSRTGSDLRNVLASLASNDAAELNELFPDDQSHLLYNLLNTELTKTFTAEDIAMFERTHEIWKKYGMQFVLILFFRSLVFTYAAEKPGNVLRMTRLLEDHPTRRIIETGQFVFDVMEQKWWEPQQRGILTSVKIRLMHAAMRYMLLQHQGDEPWQIEKWGMPISQEDMIATNQVFSLEFFQGLQLIGDPLPEGDQEAWFYTWKYIGRIMGVQEELLMPNVDEAWELQRAVYAHLFHDEPVAGIGLAKALVETMATFMMSRKLVLLIMKRMLTDKDYPDTFNRLLGPSYAAEFPSLFAIPANGEDDAAIHEQNDADFFEELRLFSAAVKDKRFSDRAMAQMQSEGIGNTVPATTKHEHEGLLSRLGDDIRAGIEKLKELGHGEKKLVDFQIEAFEEIIRKVEETRVGEFIMEEHAKIREALIRKALCATGAVMIDILSKMFRPGKMAAFRIDDNLRAHWAL